MGEIFQFQANEARSNQDINRYTSMYLGAQAAENKMREVEADAWGDVFGGVSDIFKIS